jgi:hypothetical protein
MSWHNIRLRANPPSSNLISTQYCPPNSSTVVTQETYMEFLQVFIGSALKDLLNDSVCSLTWMFLCLDYQWKIPEIYYKITRLPLCHGLWAVCNFNFVVVKAQFGVQDVPYTLVRWVCILMCWLCWPVMQEYQYSGNILRSADLMWSGMWLVKNDSCLHTIAWHIYEPSMENSLLIVYRLS